MEILLPVAERSASMTHARTDQAVVCVLLERMRDPSGGAADGENCGRHRARKAEHSDAYGEVEVEIGAQALVFRYRAFDLDCRFKKPPAAALGDRLRNLPEQCGARIAVGI